MSATSQQATQNIEDDAQPLIVDEDETPAKLRREDAISETVCSIPNGIHSQSCGIHNHRKKTHTYQCMNVPWGRIFLQELDMPRRDLMIRRYSDIFRTNYHSLHLIITAFKRENKNIMSVLVRDEDKYSYTLVDFLLNNPTNFAYSCMTLCDMEWLRKSIISFFGIKKCTCSPDPGSLSLSFDRFEQFVDEGYQKNLNCIVKNGNYESVKKLFKDFKIDTNYLK